MITIDLDNINQTLHDVEQYLENNAENLNAKQLYQANFICEEILTNLARHADFEHVTPKVSLKFSIDEEKRLLLRFQDNAAPFNLLEFPDPDLHTDLEEVELGGLGIYLTKQYAKNITYNYRDKTNILEVQL